MISFKISTIFLLSLLFSFSLIIEVAYAENDILPITKSETMDDVIFDGKWTHQTEWKHSSLLELENELYIRTAHQGDFVYFLINFAGDTSIDLNKDLSMICLDTENNKSKFLDDDDYCFILIHGQEQGTIIQNKIPINHENFIAISSVSDANDRYSKTPHLSYEFKIPTDLIGRSDNYGILIQVYDSSKNEIFIWPTNIISNSTNSIPSPTQWGNLISPDKSLPEFSKTIFLSILLPMIILLSIVFGKNFQFTK